MAGRRRGREDGGRLEPINGDGHLLAKSQQPEGLRAPMEDQKGALIRRRQGAANGINPEKDMAAGLEGRRDTGRLITMVEERHGRVLLHNSSQICHKRVCRGRDGCSVKEGRRKTEMLTVEQI